MSGERTWMLRAEAAHRDECIAFGRSAEALWPDSAAGVLTVGTGAAVFMGPGMYVNRAIGLGLEPCDPDSIDRASLEHAVAFGGQLDAVEEFYARLDVGPVLQTCEATDERLLRELTARGYVVESKRNVHIYDPDPVMTDAGPRDVTDPGATDAGSTDTLGSAPSAPASSSAVSTHADELRIETVDDALFPVWRDVHGEGFVRDSTARRTNDRFCEAAHAVPTAEDFIAFWVDTPVAVASVITKDGVAWLGGMATRPDFRGRGFQAALLRHRVARALAAGCDLVVTTTDPESGSERNVLRAGFRFLMVNATYARP
ncbi:MAG: GNAT family N-acetyltransferase [Candidatus Eisenbacteria bacterium]